MYKLSITQRNWTKVIHLFSACLWGGGAMSMVLIHCAFTPLSGDELYARDLCLKIIDEYVVTSGALGCLFTGAIFCVAGGWGFFRLRWIVLKWALNVGYILFGLLCYMPWLEEMARLSGSKRMMALQTPEYLKNQTLNEISAFAVLASLAVLVWVSVFKPWGAASKRKNRHRR